MTRLLLWFAAIEGTAVAAFLWLPLPIEERVPANLLPWTLGVAGVFAILAWPLLEARGEPGDGERTPGGHAAETGERLLLLAAAFGPFAGAAAALAPIGWGAFARACAPAGAALVAGALSAFAVRVGGPAFARAAVAAALGAIALGPIGRFLSGAAGSFPGDPITLLDRPWLGLASILLPAAALLARRLRAGEIRGDEA